MKPLFIDSFISGEFAVLFKEERHEWSKRINESNI